MKPRFSFYITSLLLLAVIAVSSLIGAYAYFTSQTTINSNTLSFGTLTLKLNDTYDSLTAIWSGSNLKPGDSVSGSFSVKNAGSLDAAALGLAFTNSGFNTANSPTLDHKLRITSLTYDGTELINAIQTALTASAAEATVSAVTVTASPTNGLSGLDTDADGYLSLGELNGQELRFLPSNTSLNGLTNQTKATIGMTLTFIPGSNDNNYQGDSVNTNITGTLYQVAP